jgi:hypothetical protein
MTTEQVKLQILKQLKQAKDSGNTSGLFPSTIRSFDDYNEYDGHQRERLGELFREMERDGFISRDTSVNRSNGYTISNRVSPFTRIKEGTGHERVSN